MSNSVSTDFLHEMSQFNFHSKYARFNDTYSRRETWDESINRVLRMHLHKYKHLPQSDLDKIKGAFQLVKDKRVVPSMRSMQFGGKAILSNNLKIYNCTVRQIDSIRAFAEVMYALLCGCGVGIGVTRTYIDRLPELVDANDKTGSVISYTIQDSIEGWADSVEALLLSYVRNNALSGRKIVFDYSKIRAEGTPIKTGGGRAPGYKGLKATHKKIKLLLDHLIENLQQRKLKPINVYDILMHCSDAVLSGGVRRSATIVIFDKDDIEMRQAKTYFSLSKYTKFSYDDDIKKWSGKVTVQSTKVAYEVEVSDWEYKNDICNKSRIGWVHIEPQRARSNNSVLLMRSTSNKKDFAEIVEQAKEFGEPGFVFANDPRHLNNPCVEISFIPQTEDGICGMQNCNLTSVNGARITTVDEFLECVDAATLIGTLQAGYTDFKYLNQTARYLTEEEALLGVSIAGALDNPKILLDPEIQRQGAAKATEVNKKWAKKLGIKQAARITCGKPDGNTSVLFGSAPGFHPHHARRYFRRIQCSKTDPVYKFFKEHNPHMCEESVWSSNKTDDVITFPITAPETAIIKSDLTAIKHLDIVKSSQMNWVVPGTTEANNKPLTHNISCTILVKEEEWKEVTDYLYNNKDFFTAVSLLPYCGDKLYNQAPLEAVTTPEDEERWKIMVEKYQPINYKDLHEQQDETHMQETLSCVNGACEVV